jgi:hypothetical protein
MLICYVHLNFEFNMLRALCVRISSLTADLVAKAFNVLYRDDALISSRLAHF